MSSKIVWVVLILGLIAIAMVAYYLFIFSPQQRLIELQLQQQAQQAQIQQAIAYCQSIGQQYNFSTGGCEAVPITVTTWNWVTGGANSVLQGADYWLNPLNPNSWVSQTFGGVVNLINPFSPTSLWVGAWKALFGG
jgi:hypothetical protein